MTSQEAFKGIKQIEAQYGQRFAPADIAPVWSRLLELPAAAMIHAVGEMKMLYKRFPTMREVLALVDKGSKRLQTEQVIEEFAEGKEQFALTIGFLEGRISEQQYITALYEMARKYGRPEYALEASNRETALQEQKHETT